MQAGPTGEPGKAPDWSAMVVSAATILPSRVAPILTLSVPPEVGPEARKTSERSITIFTGLPDFCDRRIATGSR